MNAAPGAGEATVRLVVGLGNPGAEYRDSRHNAGFMVIDRLLAGFPGGAFTESHLAESHFWTGRFRGRALMLQQPLTYMNLSGQAVSRVAKKFQLAPEEILIVVDDLDLPLGRLRLRTGGSSGGHNGLKSVIEELGSDRFRRLRIGIGRPDEGTTVDYVLSGFSGSERETFEAVIAQAAEAVRAVLSSGFSRAMNKYNAPPQAAKPEAETQATDKETIKQ